MIRFAVFEVDTQTGELRKHGIRLKLADQPFRVLMALLEQPGGLVSREELKQRIWAQEEFGDFEQGLNRTVSRLREVLGDSAARPRFIETLPGRGYRFIYPVERPGAEPTQVDTGRRRRSMVVVAGAVGLAMVVGCAAWLFLPPPVAPLRWRKLTTDNFQKMPPALSDGTRIYMMGSFAGEQSLVQVPLEGGQPARLPVVLPGPYAALQDISADGQELLLTASGKAGLRVRSKPLWALRVADGTARRLGEIMALSAAYEPRTGRIAYTSGPELWVADTNGLGARRLVELKGTLLDSVHWMPKGTRIRFAQRDPVSGRSTAWEVRKDGSGLRQVFAGWTGNHTPLGWTPDGRTGVFAGGGMIWADPEPYVSLLHSARKPLPLLTDAPEFVGMSRLRNGGSFHMIGIDRLAELQRYDAGKRTWTPLFDGLSADGAEYSRDGQRFAYVTYPQHTLWVRQAGGSKPIQLTSAPSSAMFPRWSPDGGRIAFNAQEAPGKPVRLYTVDSNGGVVRPVLPAERGSQGYSTWDPGGGSLLYGVVAANASDPAYIRVVDLSSGRVSKLEGSDGLFAPRYSPDGKILAAHQHAVPGHLMLYHVRENRWEEVPGGGVNWPAWAPDSRSILFERDNGIVRYQIATRTLERVAEGTAAGGGGYFDSRCAGVTPDGWPMRILNRDSRQVYELRFEGR